MSKPRFDRRWSVGLALIALIALVGAGVAWRAADTTEPSQQQARDAEAPASTGRRPLPRRTRTEGAGEPGTPRPVPAAAPPAPLPAGSATVRPAPLTTAAEVQKVFGGAMDPVLGEMYYEVQNCAARNAPRDPEDSVTGRIDLFLRFDGAGLTDAEVTDTTGIPEPFLEPFLECVADTVWEVEWPRAPNGPAEIIFPVIVSSD